MFLFYVNGSKVTVHGLVRILVFLLVSATLGGCERNGSDDKPAPVNDPAASEGALTPINEPTESGEALVPDNEPTEVLGDWTTGCVENLDTNGTLSQHLLLTYSIDENNWVETIEHYALDDPGCANLLGTVVYAYQIEILNSATAATLNGSFVGNATDINVIDTTVDLFGDATAEDRGSALGIWLVKDDILYSRLVFDGARPEDLLGNYSFRRN